jgi:phage terminase large subunit-like protein
LAAISAGKSRIAKAADPKLVALKRKKLELLKASEQRRLNLPHLLKSDGGSGYPFYPWQRAYWESRKSISLVVGCNQVGKSSVSIRKCIHWATGTEIWPELFPKEKPRLYFYFYPSLKLATREFFSKWVPLFMPKDKSDPKYGWRYEMKNGEIQRISFNSGVTVEFLSYAMRPQDLQASSPHAVFADEEMPEAIFGEIIARLFATRGYFSMIFTATLGQEFWREALEGQRLPDAFKTQFSLYDCLTYEDGSKSWIDEEDVRRREAAITSQWEKEIRIYGRFATAEGLLFSGFDRYENVTDAGPVPADWSWYAGVDVGSGGTNHPAAIAFVALSPDRKLGRVVRCWRGNREEVTTAPSILAKYHQLRAELNVAVVAVHYDWASKDFETFALADGLPVIKAEKSHEIGIPLMNGLFKSQRLMIDDIDENYDLIRELLSVRIGQSKKHRADDACDAVRYAITKIPWDLTGLSGQAPQAKKTKDKPIYGDRRDEQDRQEDALEDLDGEIEFWRQHFEH